MIRLTVCSALLLFGMILSLEQGYAREILHFTNDRDQVMTLQVYSYRARRWRAERRFAPGERRPVEFNSNELYYLKFEDDRGIGWPLGAYNITKVRRQNGKYLEIRLSVITARCMSVQYAWRPQCSCWVRVPEHAEKRTFWCVRWFRWPKPPPRRSGHECVPLDCWCPTKCCPCYCAPSPCCW